LIDWPDAEMDEATFLSELMNRTEALLLLDVENVYANVRNFGGDPVAFLERLPLDRVAYVHVAGGYEAKGVWHDTHSYAIPKDVYDLLEELCARAAIPGAMLERDDKFPTEPELNAELDGIAAAMHRGEMRRHTGEFTHHAAAAEEL
jgi:uncharacterized protein (UPF0276 family)